MKKLLSLLAMGAACLFLLLPSASATTLTFDALTTDAEYVDVEGSSYTESGYVFTVDAGGILTSYGSLYGPDDGGSWAGSAGLSEAYGSYGYTLTSTDSSLFSLDSIDISELFTNWDGTVDAVAFTITATYADGTTYVKEISTDETFGFETYVLGDEFTNLASVYFSGEYYQIDNVVVNTATSEVPLPLPLVLLGSGLLVTGAVRKRQA